MERLTNRDREIPLPKPENAVFWASAHEKLAQYEDAEEQGRLVVLPEPTPDIDFMRIFNLIMADAEDRVIVLPCNVGDEVYYITGYGIYKAKAITFRFNKSGIRVYCERKYMGVIGFEGIYGKTVFLSREEAEAALKGDGAQCEL